LVIIKHSFHRLHQISFPILFLQNRHLGSQIGSTECHHAQSTQQIYFQFYPDGYLLLDVISTSNHLPVTRGCSDCLLSTQRSFIPTSYHWKVFTMRSSKEGTANCRKTSQSLRANFSQGVQCTPHT